MNCGNKQKLYAFLRKIIKLNGNLHSAYKMLYGFKSIHLKIRILPKDI